MMLLSRFCVVGSAAVLMMAAASVQAEVIATVTYDDLDGNFAFTGPNAGVFTANAVDRVGRNSSMTASRLVPIQNNANFPAGFVSLPDSSNLQIVINTNTLTLHGIGSFVATDVDGDTITGDIDGDWANIAGIFMAFNGSLSNVLFNGAVFNGQAGSFGTSFFSAPPYDGAIVQLTTAAGGFAGIINSDTGGDLQITPAPGTLALLGLAGFAGRRRR